MEQQLIEDLVVESIKQYGIDAFYCPRTVIARDGVFREQTTAEFHNAFELEMYIVDVQGFTGDGKFLSKFGLEIRDELTFAISMRSFNSDVAAITNQLRPNEGDVIYLPLNGKAFQIKFVDHETVFYQIGSLQFYTLVCEVFEYSNEIFETGNPTIDSRYQALSTDVAPYAILTEAGNPLTDENGNPLIDAAYSLEDVVSYAQNDEFQTDADEIMDWSEHDPFSESGVY